MKTLATISALLFVGLSTSASAATLIVDKGLCPSSCLCTPGLYGEIGCAIADAQGGDTISIQGPHTYFEHALTTHVPLTFQGIKANGLRPVIDGQVVDGIIRIGAGTQTVTFENIDFINGAGPQNPIGFDRTAGAISDAVNFAYVTVRDCGFINNSGEAAGAIDAAGGLRVERSDFVQNHGNDSGAIHLRRAAVIEDSMFRDNTSNLRAGAISSFGWPFFEPFFVFGSTFWGNQSTNGAGAINIGPVDALVQGSTFAENMGKYGGAILAPGALADSSGGVLTAVDNIYDGNVAGQGGALAFLTYGQTSEGFRDEFEPEPEPSPGGGGETPPCEGLALAPKHHLVKGSVFTRQLAVLGGSIYTEAEVDLELQDLDFSENQAGNADLFFQDETFVVGKAIRIDSFWGPAVQSDSALLDLTNVLIEDSLTAMSLNDDSCLSMSHGTFAGGAYGIYVAPTSQALVQSSVFAENNQSCSGVVTSQDHNLDDDGTCAFFEPDDLSTTAPLWSPDRMPTSQSPLYDSANPVCGGPAIFYDARSAPHSRVIDATCDRGALEREILVCNIDGQAEPGEPCDMLIGFSCPENFYCTDECECMPL